jgi:hypothetical protein
MKLTGAYVYRGHNQISSEKQSTVKNGGLGTLANINIDKILKS